MFWQAATIEFTSYGKISVPHSRNSLSKEMVSVRTGLAHFSYERGMLISRRVVSKGGFEKNGVSQSTGPDTHEQGLNCQFHLNLYLNYEMRQLIHHMSEKNSSKIDDFQLLKKLLEDEK